MLGKILLIVMMTFFLKNGIAQHYNTDSIISILFKDIENNQIKERGEFYPGMFYSFRGSSAFPHNYQPDNNIFFTAIGNFTLKNIKPSVHSSHYATIDSILYRSKKAYSFYQKREGLPFYNFWPTGSVIMPHSFIFQYLTEQFNISEDADDTSMILMTQSSNDSSNTFFKKRLIEVSNLGIAGKKNTSTYKRFRNHKAYTTYLGYKMQTDFDFSVQCNILYFVYSSGLPFCEQDSATLDLLTQMTKERLYMSHPSFISPYYGKSSLILYHLTRFMSTFHPDVLESYKPIIIKDLFSLLDKATIPIEKIIIQTSLLRMGEHVDLPLENEIQEIRMKNQHQFSFFQARAAYWYRPWLKNIFLHCNLINSDFYSPTYDKILLLENLALRKQSIN